MGQLDHRPAASVSRLTFEYPTCTPIAFSIRPVPPDRARSARTAAGGTDCATCATRSWPRSAWPPTATPSASRTVRRRPSCSLASLGFAEPDRFDELLRTAGHPARRSRSAHPFEALRRIYGESPLPFLRE